MPRAMPALAGHFNRSVTAALGIAEAGEIVRTLSAPRTRSYREMSLARLEALHEMAYLRIFVEWENFLEASFLRMMCGYHSPLYTPTLAPPKVRQSTLAGAFMALSPTRPYLLWHNPQYLVDRGRKWFVGGPHELIGLSNYSRLEWFANVRHRIAHGSEDARNKLDTATMGLAGRRYRASSAGRFLRDWNSGVSPPERWLYTIGGELVSLAAQICP